MKRNTSYVLAAALAAAAAVSAQEVKVDSDTFGGLEARAIGPAVMSGRVTSLDAVAGERLTIYVGSAGGGVWKSTDGGVRFKAVFDKHNQSIGDVKVDPNNAKTVWVGTGETWVRNSVSVGDGVYKSTDAGDNWERVGLESTERIARIQVTPGNSDTVFVCALGHLFDSHPERGVYRTKNAGKTWEKVLSVDNDTGCADLAIDPQDGNILYAAMWQVRRMPYFFKSGGPGSGLYKSTDGGSNWKKLTTGLPSGELGRMALTVSPVRPSRVWATVEAKETALYRSDDLGESWSRISNSQAVTGRPFYFSRLVADPIDKDRVYKPGFGFAVSEDGGKTFGGGGGGQFGGNYHGDVHAVWVNPKNNEQLMIGTDGGVYLSDDRGNHWRFVGSLPIGQFYHVSADMEWPYNVYGGLQDNSSWYGPSRRPSGGIGAKHWNSLSPGDGFWTFPDPSDPDIIYDEIQGGNLYRNHRSTGERKDIRPAAKAGERLRFNWNAPIHLSATQKGTMYYGAQVLFRSKDRGETWERISGDLTTNDPNKLKQDESGGLTLDNSTAENHCTIFAISESPKNKDVIWVGTDDGNVQVTRDGGKTWSNVSANVSGVPKATWVSSIQASSFEEGTAYATFDGHMTGDMKTYVYKTADFGKTWTALASEDMKGYAHVVKEDLVNANLLFAGTEFGLWISLDGGTQWAKFTSGLPPAAVRDLFIHPREGDLVIATHGRSLYILDDLTPLRKLTPKNLDSEVAFLESRASAMVAPAFEFGFNGDTEFEGRSPGEVAYITYYLKKRHIIGDLKLEVYDSAGRLVSTVPGGKRKGINRVEWPMRANAPRIPAAAQLIPNFFALLGPRTPEGTYTVKMIKNKDSFTSQVTLVPDPRSKHTAQDRSAQHEMVGQLYKLLERLAYVVETITDVRDQARARAEKLTKGDDLRRRLETVGDTMENQRKALVASKESEGISGEEKLREELGMLYANVNGYEGRPTQSQRDKMALLSAALDAAAAKFETSFGKDVAPLNVLLEKRKLEAVKKSNYEEWDKKTGKK